MMKIRYGYIKNLTLETYKNFNINTYPIDLVKLIKKYPYIRAISYSKLMKDYNISLNKVIEIGDSSDGYTSRKGNNFIIFYNDLIKSKQRQAWTLAHELGHIIIGHLDSEKTKVFRNELSNDEYDWMEKEADFFASQLLANDLILKEIKVKNAYELSKICNLSKQASENRFYDYKRTFYLNFKLTDLDKIILKQFKLFINTKICVNCKANANLNDKFCSICSNLKFERSYTTMIYDDGYQLDEQSKSIKCPKCENEIIENGEYCNICGIYLVNKCSKGGYDINDEFYYTCNELASGNSRFCSVCGTKTTFFENGLLLPFKKYLKKEKEDDYTPF